ncbi:leishmanolysin family protein, putative [Ichthyophthirius multifiliis]|uniref:Leishmanolysin family protein, putative n=1 Tax=Ichthyophthirius multifiliis TaxID=5932 RepID=G0QQP9_ICHMU|nr:leishmanolysin family protein, putative [Ichthyophthirius multifiliis]EGR32455.1 leishmanolysin family protein, putative [Ichthyophthirius multifiliis]|eukprot:XP_004036441.1 leishmanolysin family protein, putative [Ichthyophthirius multifiliis]
MNQIQEYLQKLLKLIPAQGPNIYNNKKCYDIDVNEKYRKDGERNSDIHIWVVQNYNNPQNSVLADAIYCQMDDTLKRVNFGRIKINMQNIYLDGTNYGYQRDFNNILHEIFHILGFSSGLYRYWINPSTGNYYGNEVDNYVSQQFLREKQILILQTPNVLATAQKYYACLTLKGMQLQNDENIINSTGSHWEKTILFDELMVAYSSGKESQLSVFTIALLRDTGYYAEVNESMANDIQWGRNKGCDFFLKACYSDTFYPEFVYQKSFSNQCTFQNNGYGKSVKSKYMDYCHKISNQFTCDDSNKKNDEMLEYFGTNSKCLKSTAHQELDTSYKSNTRCHHVVCSPDYTQVIITITQLNNKKLICTKQYQGKEIDVMEGQPQFGYIYCPDNYREFCSQTPECPNHCSRKGICLFGQCRCQSGWSGSDCNVDEKKCPYYTLEEDPQRCVEQCPIGKLENPDKVCRSNCPNGLYFSYLSRQCVECNTQCLRCSGPSKNQCLECGFLKYLEEGQCVNQCSNNFILVNQRKCVKSVNQGCEQECEKCDSENKVICTKCKDQYFLNLNTGKCVAASDCPQETFANKENNTCQICEITGCIQCQSQTVCQVCDEQLEFLKKGDQCAKCPQGCLKCSSDLQSCTVCYNGLFLLEGQCLYNCPFYLYTDKKKENVYQLLYVKEALIIGKIIVYKIVLQKRLLQQTKNNVIDVLKVVLVVGEENNDTDNQRYNYKQ